jgi:outer membrane receptor for ferrienterochelin and colicin
MLSSSSGFAQNLKVSGSYSKSNLNQVLQDIETRYPVRFFYLDKWLFSSSIDQQFNDQPIHEVLDKLLENSDLSYLVYDDDKIIIGKTDRIKDSGTNEYFLATRSVKTQHVDDKFPMLTAGDSLGIGDSSLNQLKLQFIDANQQTPLEGVSVYFEKLERTINSNPNGQIDIALPAGIYQMEARRVGYEPFICNLKILSNDELKIEMEQEAIELMEVVVSGESADQRLMDPQTGLVSLTPKQIKEMPSFLGEADVIKTIQTLPGVTTIGEGAPGFYVRGGNIDQNLILQDGAIFSNSSHALGFFSLFNPDLISSVQLYKGSIPAQYGGRLSSVLDVQLKGSNYTNTTITGGVGTVMSKLAIETPIIKDKVSLLAGGRISYADWILPVIKIPEIQESKAFFYDFNLKMSAKVSEFGSIDIGYFQSFDRVNFQGEAGFEWTIKNFSLNYNQQIGQTVQSEFNAAMGNTDNLNFDPSGVNITQLANGLQFYKIKENLTIPIKNHLLMVGGEWIYYQPKDETLEIVGSQEPENDVHKDFGQELGLYFNDTWNITETIALSAGLRTSFLFTEEYQDSENNQQYTILEPRVSFRYGFSKSSSVKASFNRMSQFIHLLSNTTGVLPVDQWIVSNSKIAPSKSNNLSIGYFRNFTDDSWESSMELFYRRMTNIIEFKDFADLVLNPELEEEILQGDGKAYGMELFLRRHTGKLKGSLSYTFSRTYIKTPLLPSETAADWFPAKFDRPHNLNLVVDWTVNRRSRFGLVFNFTSGRPITAPVSSYNLGNVVVPNYSSRNEYRIPNYHRLDLSYTYKRSAVKQSRFQDSITFSIYNVYSRRNAFSVFFRKESNQPAKAYRLSVLGSAFPSITYTFEFK